MSDLLEHYSWPNLPKSSAHRTLRLNILLGSSGELVGNDGTSASLSTPTDRELLRAIRAEADCVIVGAQSVRTEGWFLPPAGTLVIYSASGDLPWQTCPDPQRVAVVNSPAELADFVNSVKGNVLCEGGLTLARTLQQLVGFDDIALSLKIPHISNPLTQIGATDAEYDLIFSREFKTEGIVFQLWRRATYPS